MQALSALLGPALHTWLTVPLPGPHLMIHSLLADSGFYSHYKINTQSLWKEMSISVHTTRFEQEEKISSLLALLRLCNKV